MDSYPTTNASDGRDEFILEIFQTPANAGAPRKHKKDTSTEIDQPTENNQRRIVILAGSRWRNPQFQQLPSNRDRDERPNTDQDISGSVAFPKLLRSRDLRHTNRGETDRRTAPEPKKDSEGHNGPRIGLGREPQGESER